MKMLDRWTRTAAPSGAQDEVEEKKKKTEKLRSFHNMHARNRKFL